MAASTASGGDGLLSVSTEASGGGDEDERDWVRESEVMRGVIQTHRGSGGKQEVAGRVRARRGRTPVLLAEKEDDRKEEVGWAGFSPGPGGWPAQVSSLSLLFICSIFLFLLFCFYLVY